MDLPEGSDVWDFEENSTRYEICYTKESIRHPAKMNIPLCREIIKRYSKKGDLILDPMSGIFTTGVEGAILGRNVIGVEYEQRFVDMAKANIKLVEEKMGFLKGLGKAVIVKGDSRELFKVLEGLAKGGLPDNIIFSPPFGDNAAYDSKRQIELGKNRPCLDASFKNYSGDKNNKDQIGNLDYEPLEKGAPDVVLFSPPFSNANPCSDAEKAQEAKKKWKENNIKGGSGFLDKIYSENPDNVGNKEYGNVNSIIMSPPFSGATQGAGIAKEGHVADSGLKDRVYGNLDRTNNNIEVLPHGNVDTVITSPPYGNRLSDEAVNDGDIARMSYRQSGIEEKDNLGNLQADAIVTSPPYGHESTTSREEIHKPRDIHSSRFNEINYSEDPSNCGNLKGKSYLSEMFRIYQQCFLVLKNGGTMVLVLKNFVKKGETVRLDIDTIKIVEASGFKFYRRHYRKIRSPSFWIINAIKKWQKKFPNKPHPYPLFEDVLVFKKELQDEIRSVKNNERRQLGMD